MAILILSLGLCGCDTRESASVGSVKLISAGKQYAPFQNFVYSRNRDGLYADGMKKQPQEVADELETISISNDVRIDLNGKRANSCYTLYDEHNQKVYDCRETFLMPEEPGKYIICVNVTWGTKEVYNGMEYFFMINRQ
jgi:hypothetical protein